MISEKGGRELGSLASVTLMVHALPLTPVKLLRLAVFFYGQKYITPVKQGGLFTLCVNRHVL